MARLLTENDPIKAFKPFRLVLEFNDPEDAEHFLQGVIVARSNNSNETFVDIINGINAGLEAYRSARVLSEVQARDA